MARTIRFLALMAAIVTLPATNPGLVLGDGAASYGYYNMMGGVDNAVPVDVYVPGCAARPEAILQGVLAGVAALEKKVAASAAGRAS